MTGIPAGEGSRYEQVLVALGFTAEVLDDPQEAGKKLETERFEVVVSGYPLEPGALGQIVAAMRGRDSINSSSALILLSPRSSLRGAAGLVGRGVNKALSTEEEPTVLGIVAQRMVEFNQPMAERLPLRLKVSTDIDGEDSSWFTENLSGGGMLICTRTPPPLGGEFSFSLELESGTVTGAARVVRHTACGQEAVDGFGARFLSFDGDGRRRLLEELRSSREAALAAGDGSDGCCEQ